MWVLGETQGPQFAIDLCYLGVGDIEFAGPWNRCGTSNLARRRWAWCRRRTGEVPVFDDFYLPRLAATLREVGSIRFS